MLETVERLAKQADTKIVLLVLDGLGGLADPPRRETELEKALTPNFDALAEQSICGLHEPVDTGISPGSGPGHLALFGYDPLACQVGRGVLAALGIDFDLQHGDVAARGNFCTLDDEGKIRDRRAGRIDTSTAARMCEALRGIEVPDVEVFVEAVKDYRFALILRGDNLCANIADTDPQAVGTSPLKAVAQSEHADPTARRVNAFIEQAASVLQRHKAADMILLRGFSKMPQLQTLGQTYGFNAAAAAGYPMYRGISRLAGMDILSCGSRLADPILVAEKHWQNYDFFFLHVKGTDSAGEDGDFDRKVALIEEVDGLLPDLMYLQPDVLIVTGDHSTPAVLQGHSWHPVPVLLYSRTCRPDRVSRFGESACIGGGLGPRFPGRKLMQLAAAHAGRLRKFGA